MKSIDFCMMVTTDGRGTHHTRPMSNNRQVDFDGDCWFFANKVKQLHTDANVSLIYQGGDMVFMHAYGAATIVKQRAILEKHWIDELKQWYPGWIRNSWHLPDTCKGEQSAVLAQAGGRHCNLLKILL